jgi:SmpA / OmlA family
VHLPSQIGRALLVVVTLALGVVSGSACAQTNDVELAALRAQYEQIKTLVERFDERLKALEAAHQAAAHAAPIVASTATTIGSTVVKDSGMPPTTAAVSQPAPAGTTRVDAPTASGTPSSTTTAAPDRHAWRQVASGTTQADVARLLGQPTTTFQLSGKTVWYYYYPAKGAGSVFFDSAGRASSVQRPATGW